METESKLSSLHFSFYVWIIANLWLGYIDKNRLHLVHPMHPSFQSLTSHMKKRSCTFYTFYTWRKFYKHVWNPFRQVDSWTMDALCNIMEPLWKNAQPPFGHGTADFDRKAPRLAWILSIIQPIGGSVWKTAALFFRKVAPFEKMAALNFPKVPLNFAKQLVLLTNRASIYEWLAMTEMKTHVVFQNGGCAF